MNKKKEGSLFTHIVVGAARGMVRRGQLNLMGRSRCNTNWRRERHIGEARKYFFFEKKKQKTFDYYRPSGAWGPFILERQYAQHKTKVFWFFFSKNCFPGACLPLMVSRSQCGLV
jgi:hypothetical protein